MERRSTVTHSVVNKSPMFKKQAQQLVQSMMGKKSLALLKGKVCPNPKYSEGYWYGVRHSLTIRSVCFVSGYNEP